ncbi:MAG: hypothetical protein EYC70_02950 [Planctomycetota bacterium]|nr:MAG: hypothetical protein EYC70_02950 [Planctomycetota bacterium]
MAANLGHETSGLSDSKFEITVDKDDMQIPIAIEISGSTRYIWLTADFGDVPEGGFAAEKANELLRRNFKLQPAHFYVTDKDSFMIALPVENRAVEPSILRRALDKLAGDVASTQDLWGG